MSHAYFEKFLPSANEVWGKVIFSVACVKNSVHRWGGLSQCMLGYHHPPPPEQTLPSRHPLPRSRPRRACTTWRRHPPCSACWEIRSTRGRYASHWNAFLCNMLLIFISLFCYCFCFGFSRVGTNWKLVCCQWNCPITFGNFFQKQFISLAVSFLLNSPPCTHIQIPNIFLVVQYRCTRTLIPRHVFQLE